MSRIASAVAGLFGRLFRPAGPSAVVSQAHREWVHEQLREYSADRLHAGPLDPDLNPTQETWEMRLAYRKALKEPAVKGPLLKKVYAVASLDVQVLPEDADSPADRDAADWFDWAVQHSRGGWPRLLHDCCVHPLIDGFAVGEKVTERVERGRYRGRWGLHAVKFKETQQLRFRLDRFRNVQSVRSFAAAHGGHEFDPADFLLLTHMPLWENPFGQSDIRAAYRAVNLIEAAIKLRAILLENFSGPFLVFKYGEKARIEEARRALAAARSRGYIVIDSSDDLDVVNLATSAPDQFQSTIEDLRKEAATAIAGAYLQMLESTSPQGNSETHKGVSELFEWWLAASVGSAITEQLVPDLHDPHYPADVGRPRVLLGGVDPQAAEKAMNKLKGAKDLGLPVSKKQAYELLEVEPPADPEDTLGGEGAGGPGGLPGMPGGPGAGGPTAGQPSPQTPPTPGGPTGQPTPPDGTDAGTVPPELTYAMLELAEQGDHDGVDALAELAGDPEAYAGVIGPEAKAFADGGFTGTIRDKRGVVRHYVNGRQVKGNSTQVNAGWSGQHTHAPKDQKAAEQHVREKLTSGKPLSVHEVKAVAANLKMMTVAQIKSLKAELKAKAGGKLKMDHVNALVAYAQAYQQGGAAEVGAMRAPPPPPGKFVLPDDPMKQVKAAPKPAAPPPKIPSGHTPADTHPGASGHVAVASKDIHGNAHVQSSQAFKDAHPYAGKLGKGDTGEPNHLLPDSTRPPTPSVQDAMYLNNYSWGYDEEMNAALRDTGAPPPGDYGEGETGKASVNGPKLHASLQKQFAAAKPFKPPVTVKRGITVPADVLAGLEASARKAMDGKGAARMPGYISTSTGGGEFSGNVTFEIEASHGLDLKPYSHFGDEAELLLNHNSKFRVVGVERTGDKLHLKLSQIPPDEQARTAVVLDGKGK